MKFDKFEDIKAWQLAKEIVLDLYRIFAENKDYDFKRQIIRAGLSIMNNIAEGYERQTNNEFKQFLYIAKGSCGEVRSMLYAALELHYIKEVVFEEMMEKTKYESRMLSNLIKTL